jgi:hypothetical protein
MNDDQNDSDDFIMVANLNDIQPSQMKEVQIDGEDVCIVIALAIGLLTV